MLPKDHYRKDGLKASSLMAGRTSMRLLELSRQEVLKARTKAAPVGNRGKRKDIRLYRQNRGILVTDYY